VSSLQLVIFDCQSQDVAPYDFKLIQSVQLATLHLGSLIIQMIYLAFKDERFFLQKIRKTQHLSHRMSYVAYRDFETEN
jgi:hypothetical protein